MPAEFPGFRHGLLFWFVSSLFPKRPQARGWATTLCCWLEWVETLRVDPAGGGEAGLGGRGMPLRAIGTLPLPFFPFWFPGP